MAFPRGTDASVKATLQFGSGIDATVACSMESRQRRLDLAIEGTMGTTSLSNLIAPQLESKPSVRTPRGSFERKAEGPPTYEAQCAHVLEQVSRGASAMTGGEDAIANIRILEKIRDRSEEHGQ